MLRVSKSFILFIFALTSIGFLYAGELPKISGQCQTDIIYKKSHLGQNRTFNWIFWRDSKVFKTKRTIGPFERARGLGESCEVWSKRRGGEVIQSRVFMNEKRVIEFSHDDLLILDYKSSWDEVACFASISAVKKYFKLEDVSKWKDSYIEEIYSHNFGEIKYTVSWLPELQIARSLIVENKSMTISVTLKDVESGHSYLDQLPDISDQFIRYDFADLGDLEEEPGLVSLIHKYSIPHQVCRVKIDQP